MPAVAQGPGPSLRLRSLRSRHERCWRRRPNGGRHGNASPRELQPVRLSTEGPAYRDPDAAGDGNDGEAERLLFHFLPALRLLGISDGGPNQGPGRPREGSEIEIEDRVIPSHVILWDCRDSLAVGTLYVTLEGEAANTLGAHVGVVKLASQVLRFWEEQVGCKRLTVGRV